MSLSVSRPRSGVPGSVKTASVHVSNILRNLGVASREEAARTAHRAGILAAK